MLGRASRFIDRDLLVRNGFNIAGRAETFGCSFIGKYGSPVPPVDEFLASALGAEPGSPQLESALALVDQRYREAAAAWPGVTATKLRYAQSLIAGLKGTALEPHLAGLFTVDLYLAAACVEGDQAALEHVGGSMLPSVCESLGRVTSTFSADEACQRLRERLLMREPDAATPVIANYAGTGALLSWLRASALRELLLDKRKDELRTQREAQALEESAPEVDVELELLRRLHTNDFRVAFEGAFQGLSPRDRTLLRMHVIDGLSIDDIAAVYHTHRTTAFRWLVAARQTLAVGIRSTLSTKFGLSRSALDSFMGLLGSEKLDVSLNRLMQTSLAPPTD